ncbi:GguC family protein [soil metagenome]
MWLIQLRDGAERSVARIDGHTALILEGVSTTRDLALGAHRSGTGLDSYAASLPVKRKEDYAALLKDGRVLSPIDHTDPAHCYVTGTGLTNLGGAEARNKMHQKLSGHAAELTDSLKMFNLGLEGGKPTGDAPGVQPEWFYKGDGTVVSPPGGDLPLPDFALDGGEEPEIAGLYVVAPDGTPLRLGFALGNEYSDHVTERQNYLYLAHSKLRYCAIGPEARTGELPGELAGESRILRDGKVLWSKPFLSGEANMSHAIANLEYHHFKYGLFRRPGDVHIHFFGTATLSFTDGLKTQAGDVFEIEMAEFGAPLRNRLAPVKTPFAYRGVKAL